MDGKKFSVFDRSVLVSNGVLHSKVSTSFILLFWGKLVMICSIMLLYRLLEKLTITFHVR